MEILFKKTLKDFWFCRFCHYWQQGSCIRHAPKVFKKILNDHTFTAWPETNADEKCGDFHLNQKRVDEDNPPPQGEKEKK